MRNQKWGMLEKAMCEMLNEVYPQSAGYAFVKSDAGRCVLLLGNPDVNFAESLGCVGCAGQV